MIKPLKIKYNKKYDTHTINKMLHEESRMTVLAEKMNEIIKHINRKEVTKMNGKKITANPMKSPTVRKGESKPKGVMNFGDAMNQVVLKGKKVTRLAWDKGWFLFLYKEEDLVALSDPDGEVHSFTLRGIDVTCKDYVVA